MNSPDLADFVRTTREAINSHPIVEHNDYTRWFSRGEMTTAQLQRFTIQFSVFSHLFLEAQLRKCINAPTLAGYRASKEILLNELGVSFEAGSVDGSRFRFTAAHFEWLLAFGQKIGLSYDELGKRSLGNPATLQFCQTLLRVYGSEDASTAAGASYAIEHWAAAGFWKELIAGLRLVRARMFPKLPLGFWTWHDRLEDTHAAHTDEELEAAFCTPGFNQDAFLQGAAEVLDAVAIFWEGLAAENSCEKVA